MLGRQLCCHYTKDAEYYRISSLSHNLRNELRSKQLILVRSIDWANRADAYLLHQIYHSHTNIYSVPATWNQWFCSHLSNIILIYQHIWKPLTLQWCPIENTNPLHLFVAANLEKKGFLKKMVTYGYQCRCLHWSIWHIIHKDIVR